MSNIFKKKDEFQLPKRMWSNKELTSKEKDLYKDSFKQIAGAEFLQLQNEYLAPYIRSLGFKGSKNNFYKHNAPWIYVIQIFKDQSGGSCALNIGIHLDYIETALDKIILPNKFRLEEAIIYKNVEMQNGNGWFFYGQTQEEGRETINIMIDLFEEIGIPFLAKFESYPYPFSDITMDDILNPNERFSSYGISEKMLSWVHFLIFLAKVNISIENKELAIEILQKARNDEYYTERLVKHGISPLLGRIDSLLNSL